MADLPTWPVSLPYPLRDDIQYTLMKSNLIRSQTDAGPDIVRRRYTRANYRLTCSVLTTYAGAQVMDDFVSITLRDVGRFVWKDFRKPNNEANVAIYRFNARPSYSEYAILDTVRISLDLELMSDGVGRSLMDISDQNIGITNV